VNVSLNLGNKLAGKTVKIRFRIGTDAGSGEAGWDIDNIAFGSTSFAGITNTPFSSLVDTSPICTDGGAGEGGIPGDGGQTDAPTNKDAGKDAAPPVTPQPEPDSGCGCRTPGHAPTGSAAVMLSMLGLLFAARRRRTVRG
jgi:MYXO-CTERM domain-containing protein